MPIFCNLIKQVLAAFAFKSREVRLAAGGDFSWFGASGKLRRNGRAAGTFQKHLTFCATAPCCAGAILAETDSGQVLPVHVFRERAGIDATSCQNFE